MTAIIERYSSRLDSNWPEPLDDLVKEVVVTENSMHADRSLGRTLNSLAHMDGIDHEVKDAIEVDAFAFGLITQSKANVWGSTYFGPLWVLGEDSEGNKVTNPPRSALTPELIKIWRSRSEMLKNAFARARYSDAAWDLAHIAGIERDVDDAREAIDAYLENDAWPDSNCETAERLGRAFSLSKSISDKLRESKTCEAIVAEALQPTSGAELHHCLLLAVIILVIPSEDTLSNADESAIIKEFVKEFEGRIEIGEPHGALGWGRHLITLYRRRGDEAASKGITLQIGNCFEDYAAKGNAMLAMHLLQKAHSLYQEAGLRDDMERVRIGIANATARSKSEMTSFEEKFEIKHEDLEAFAEEATKGDLGESRIRFFNHLLLTRQRAESHLAAMEDASQLMHTVSQSVIDSSLENSINLPAASEDREPHLIRAASQLMNLEALWIRFASDRFVVRHNLSPDELSQFGELSGVFPPNRRELRRHAFSAYLAGDYKTAIHLLIPQIEHALRLLLRHLGEPTNTTRDNMTWRQLTLNALLKKDKIVQTLGEDLSFYLRVLLSEDLGWNVRDAVCHGLVDDRWFQRPIADRLFHAVVALSINDIEPPKES